MSSLQKQLNKGKTEQELNIEIEAHQKRLDEIDRLIYAPEIKDYPELEKGLREEKLRTDQEILDKKHEIQIRKLNKLKNPDNE
jgi:hypothetical protein